MLRGRLVNVIVTSAAIFTTTALAASPIASAAPARAASHCAKTARRSQRRPASLGPSREEGPCAGQAQAQDPPRQRGRADPASHHDDGADPGSRPGPGRLDRAVRERRPDARPDEHRGRRGGHPVPRQPGARPARPFGARRERQAAGVRGPAQQRHGVPELLRPQRPRRRYAASRASRPPATCPTPTTATSSARTSPGARSTWARRARSSTRGSTRPSTWPTSSTRLHRQRYVGRAAGAGVPRRRQQGAIYTQDFGGIDKSGNWGAAGGHVAAAGGAPAGRRPASSPRRRRPTRIPAPSRAACRSDHPLRRSRRAPSSQLPRSWCVTSAAFTTTGEASHGSTRWQVGDRHRVGAGHRPRDRGAARRAGRAGPDQRPRRRRRRADGQ